MKSSLCRSESTPYYAALHRMIRAAGRRVAMGDCEDLTQLVELRQALTDAIQDGVTGLRDCGVTWESIGQATGTTKQAAIKKWNH